MALQHTSLLTLALAGAAALASNACGSSNDPIGGGAGVGPVGSAGSASAGQGSSGSNSAGTSSGGSFNTGGSAGGGLAGTSLGGSSNAGSAGAGGVSHAGSGGITGLAGAGGADHGGSAGSGGATNVEPKVGCTQLAFLFGMEPDDTPNDGSKSLCGGAVGDALSTLTFESKATFPTFTFTVKTDLGTGKTGKFASIVHVESRDLFASPWQSASGQCVLQVSTNQTLSKSARITGSISCSPKAIRRASATDDLAAMAIEKWEFTSEVLLEQ